MSGEAGALNEELTFVVEEAAEGGYVARAEGVPIFTDADSLEELRTMVRDAVRCHFEDAGRRPKMIRLHFVRDELIAA
jgi:predicted RNase H-like HicB family nuclease